MDQVRTPADLGAMARAARTVRGWSQQEAADAAGVSRRFVNMVEGGKHPNAEVWRVLALMNALGAPLHVAVPATASTTVRVTPTASATVTVHGTAPGQVPGSADDFDLAAHLDGFRKEGH